jgi:TldD protein
VARSSREFRLIVASGFSKTSYRLWGTSADGKGEPGQTNAVSHGCPPARFRQVTLLNTASR